MEEMMTEDAFDREPANISSLSLDAAIQLRRLAQDIKPVDFGVIQELAAALRKWSGVLSGAAPRSLHADPVTVYTVSQAVRSVEDPGVSLDQLAATITRLIQEFLTTGEETDRAQAEKLKDFCLTLNREIRARDSFLDEELDALVPLCSGL